MLKAIIFDVDGTLVDSVDLHAKAWKEAFSHYGYDIPYDELRSQIGKGSEHIIPEFISEQENEEFGDRITNYRKEYFQNELLSQVRPFPKVKELFERIRQDGKKIVLASSARKDTLETYQKLLDIEDIIDSATSTDDAEKSKPDPDIFQAALDKLDGINGNEVIVVGDSPFDAEAASKINLRTLGVLCGGFPESVLRSAGCFAIYSDPADLLANYENSPLAE